MIIWSASMVCSVFTDLAAKAAASVALSTLTYDKWASTSAIWFS